MSWLTRLLGTSRASAPRLDAASAPGGPPARLELFTRAGCHLCDDMKATIREAEARGALGRPVELREVDIAGDPELEAAHGRSIPVLAIDGRIAFKGRLTAEELARKLARNTEERRAGGGR